MYNEKILAKKRELILIAVKHYNECFQNDLEAGQPRQALNNLKIIIEKFNQRSYASEFIFDLSNQHAVSLSPMNRQLLLKEADELHTFLQAKASLRNWLAISSLLIGCIASCVTLIVALYTPLLFTLTICLPVVAASMTMGILGYFWFTKITSSGYGYALNPDELEKLFLSSHPNITAPTIKTVPLERALFLQGSLDLSETKIEEYSPEQLKQRITSLSPTLITISKSSLLSLTRKQADAFEVRPTNCPLIMRHRSVSAQDFSKEQSALIDKRFRYISGIDINRVITREANALHTLETNKKYPRDVVTHIAGFFSEGTSYKLNEKRVNADAFTASQIALV